jgi:predicted transcriptional regulator
MTLKPTDAELAILRILWRNGSSTVRAVHQALNDKAVRYTTTLKQLQVMHEKGLVVRDDSSRSHIYETAVSEEETQTSLLEHLLEHAFGGNTNQLFMRALSRKKASAKELAKLKALLEELEG